MFKIKSIFSKKGNAVLIKNKGLSYDVALCMIDNCLKDIKVVQEINIKKKFVKTKSGTIEDREYINKEICNQFNITGCFI